MKTLKTLKRELLANTKTRATYDELADEFALARELIAARTRARLRRRKLHAVWEQPKASWPGLRAGDALRPCTPCSDSREQSVDTWS
jgi:hypothetical protein